MMKFVFALVFLFCCCNGYKLNTTLNMEIIHKLKMLNDLCKQHNLTLPKPMHLPGLKMRTNASSCVSVFVRELRHLLQNVTVPNDRRFILEGLQANLDYLHPHHQTDDTCQMELAKESFNPFQAYIVFVKNLNKGR